MLNELNRLVVKAALATALVALGSTVHGAATPVERFHYVPGSFLMCPVSTDQPLVYQTMMMQMMSHSGTGTHR